MKSSRWYCAAAEQVRQKGIINWETGNWSWAVWSSQLSAAEAMVQGAVGKNRVILCILHTTGFKGAADATSMLLSSMPHGVLQEGAQDLKCLKNSSLEN